jgi:hypothetical protein
VLIRILSSHHGGCFRDKSTCIYLSRHYKSGLLSRIEKHWLRSRLMGLRSNLNILLWVLIELVMINWGGVSRWVAN